MPARAAGVASLIALAGATWAASLSAHALLETPAPRDQRDGYKDSTPCGVTRASTQPHTSYAPGQQLSVDWLETVDHAGCFLVELSLEGDLDFQILGRLSHADPPPPEGPTSAAPRRWSLPVTLPNVSCQDCTLRLRQIMADEDLDGDACPPPTPPPGSVYTTCANISIASSVGGDGAGGSSAGGSSAGGSSAGGSSAGGSSIGGSSAGNSSIGGSSAGVSSAGGSSEGSGCSFSMRRPTASLGALVLALVALSRRRGYGVSAKP